MKNDKSFGKISVRADGWFVVLEDIDFGDVVVPKGFDYDGPSSPSMCVPLIGKRMFIKGVYCSCKHDYQHRHKEKYPRKQATKDLVNLWQRAGLPKWQGKLVYVFVELYCRFILKWK